MKNAVQQCYDNPNEDNQVSIGILGDVDCSTWKNNGRNPLLALKPLFEKTDVVVANVETVISDDPLKPVKRGIILRIKPDGVVELSEPEQVAFRNDLNFMHRMLDDERALGDAWEVACYQAWKPKGWKNLPFFRGLYDWHRNVRAYDLMQSGATFNRATHAAYLKRQYGMDVFRLRDDERIHLED